MPNKHNVKNKERNRDIVESLRSGERPRSIAMRLGISMAAVWQVKHKANKTGAGLDKTYVTGENNISVWFEGIERLNQAEDWDDDEPFGPVQRCKCGLVMPCHSCLDVSAYTNPVSSAVWDNFPIELVGSASPYMSSQSVNAPTPIEDVGVCDGYDFRPLGNRTSPSVGS